MPSLLLGLIGLVLLLAAWFLVPFLLRLFQARGLARLCRAKRVVVLSFDDGPSRSLTPRVVRLLRRLGIRGSFFLIAERALENPEIVRRIAAGGHDLGSHTLSHLNAWRTLPMAHCRDMLDGHREVQRLAGDTRLFRPPYGKMSLASLVCAATKRLSLAWWTIDARDSLERPLSHEEVLARIAAAGGGVVLLHDHDDFPDADHADYVLGLIAKIAALAGAQGLRFATFSELFRRSTGARAS